MHIPTEAVNHVLCRIRCMCNKTQLSRRGCRSQETNYPQTPQVSQLVIRNSSNRPPRPPSKTVGDTPRSSSRLRERAVPISLVRALRKSISMRPTRDTGLRGSMGNTRSNAGIVDDPIISAPGHLVIGNHRRNHLAKNEVTPDSTRLSW